MDANTGAPRPSSPWPEPDPDEDLSSATREAGADAAAVTAELDRAGDRIVDHLDDLDDRVAEWDRRTEARGSKGVALAVAGMNIILLLAIPALLVVMIFAYITVYAIVKAIAPGADTASAHVVLLGVVGIVTPLTLLLGVGTWLIGRAADPKRRRRTR